MNNSLRINQTVYTELTSLTHFWCFKRKAIAAAITSSLADFEKQVENHIAERELHFQYQQKQQESSHSEKISGLHKHYQDEILQQKNILTTENNALQAQYLQQTTINSHLNSKIVTLNETISNTEERLSKNLTNLQALEDLKQELDESHQQLQHDYTHLHQDNLTLNERFSLVQSALSAQASKNEGTEAFHHLLHDGYAKFATEVFSLNDKTSAFLALQQVLNELEQVNAFPASAGKSIIGVAGGFSSGKSEFINSFIKDSSLKLATGLNPVTIIPSFIVCAPYSRICGYANNGGKIPLSISIYNALSHDYVSGFGFDLRSIIPKISLLAPMDNTLFEDICLVDTPGYNPGTGTLSESSDKNITIKYLDSCTAMIWVIGLDPAGTIAQSDIDFILQRPYTAENLYIVLNKADLKSEEDINLIMETVDDTLFTREIGYSGMCAYSSTRAQCYAVKEMSLDNFFKLHNKRHNIASGFDAQIDSVFGAYDAAIRQDIDQVQRMRVRIKDFEFHTLLNSGANALRNFKHVTDEFSEQLRDEKHLAQLLEKSHKMRALFKSAIHTAMTAILQNNQA